MRRPRVKADGEGFYHVVSRIGGKRFLINEAEKKILLGMIRGAAAFSGVELYSFAIMSNHFHLLVRIPRKRDVSDNELEKRMLSLYGPVKINSILAKWARWSKKHQESRVEAEKARMRARMYDLSQFCKTFKESYTQDYNKRNGNTGTIWEGRFKSILLEGSFRTMMTVAGYIHLNPIRASIVQTPEDSKWTSYGAGCQGDSYAQIGLVELVKRTSGVSSTSWMIVKETFRSAMEGKLPSFEGSDASSEMAQSKESPQNGNLREILLHRSVGFLHGLALGGESFVKRIAKKLPPRARERPASPFDRCPVLELKSAAGVREAS